MLEISFKKSYGNSLNTYLHTSDPFRAPFFYMSPLINTRVDKTLILNNLENQLDYLLSFAEFCSTGLEKFVLVKYGPLFAPYTIAQVRWNYVVLTDDCSGIGIDKGFRQLPFTDEVISKAYYFPAVLLHLPSLLLLRDIAPDELGESFSQVTLFSLKAGRVGQLLHLLADRRTPDLSQFLQTGEQFFNITVGKEKGYYNSVLVKSPSSIEHLFWAFQMVLDPNN